MMRTVIGLMSGTSMDGIDAALLRTDGEGAAEAGAFLTVPYSEGFRDRLRACLGNQDEFADIADVQRELTLHHADAVLSLLEQAGLTAEQVDLIGFHGHTILHDPDARRTWQIGDGALLARRTGIAVVDDFRTADVAAGGQGAPLLPLYHRALAAALDKPLAVLNLGGVGNVTWIGADDGVIACDTGPGNAMIDDWVLARTGRAYDEDGALARAGRVDPVALAHLLNTRFFDRPAPKSLDRDAFDPAPVAGLSIEDGAATLTAFTVESVARILPHLPQPPRRWLVTGGGRRNAAIMDGLTARLGVPVEPVETVGWNGDALEAQGFAYLAVRSRLGLPLSLPTTTGVPRPLTGGRFHEAKAD